MIYFAQPIDGGPIKIGYSANVDSRLRKLELHYGRQLVLLATKNGGRARERRVHEKFAHLRLGQTEQFQPASDLMEFIGRPELVSENPDAVEAMPPRVEDNRCSVKFDRQLAAKGRYIAGLRGQTLAEVLSELARAAIEREFNKASKGE